MASLAAVAQLRRHAGSRVCGGKIDDGEQRIAERRRRREPRR
jgi:hypothetical protein